MMAPPFCAGCRSNNKKPIYQQRRKGNHWRNVMATLPNTPPRLLFPIGGSTHQHPPPTTSHALLLLPSSPLLCGAQLNGRRSKPLLAPPCIHNGLTRPDSICDHRNVGCSTDNVLLLQGLGLDYQESEALLRKHPQLADADTESLRRRIASLRSLAIGGFDLLSTIIKSADLIMSSEMDAFLDLIHETLQDLQPTKLQLFLAAADTRALSTFREKVRLLANHGVPRERLGRFLDSLNLRKVFGDKTTEDMEATIVYLKGLDGFGWLLRRPQLLNLDLKRQLVPRIKFLVELSGRNESAAAILIGKLPYMLAYSVKHYRGHLEFWHSIGLGDEEFFKLALVYPNIFSVSRDRKLEPRVSFLRECGLDPMEIHRFLMKAPLFLSLSFEANLGKKLALLVKIGYRHGTKELATAMGWATRTSCGNMQMVVGLLLGWGFSCEDVMAMATRQPQVLQYNHASLAKKVEYLVGEMDREIGELLAFPAFLGYKLDDRIKRRYEAKKERRGKRMSINKLLSVSADRFSRDDEQENKRLHSDFASKTD